MLVPGINNKVVCEVSQYNKNFYCCIRKKWRPFVSRDTDEEDDGDRLSPPKKQKVDNEGMLFTKKGITLDLEKTVELVKLLPTMISHSCPMDMTVYLDSAINVNQF